MHGKMAIVNIYIYIAFTQFISAFVRARIKIEWHLQSEPRKNHQTKRSKNVCVYRVCVCVYALTDFNWKFIYCSSVDVTHWNIIKIGAKEIKRRHHHRCYLPCPISCGHCIILSIHMPNKTQLSARRYTLNHCMSKMRACDCGWYTRIYSDATNQQRNAICTKDKHSHIHHVWVSLRSDRPHHERNKKKCNQN